MIRKATVQDASALAGLAHRLWPQADLQELEEEFLESVQDPGCALFLCYAQDAPAGFAQCQLRRDYVEGTQTSPVGYLEGIYVEPEFRSLGYARQLVLACEQWARQMGCREFASDCELTNRNSLAFHLHTGFAEANRIICFTKKL